MNFEDIMAELPKLTPDQRDLLRVRLAELAGAEWMDDGELSSAEMALIEERIAEYRRDPSSSISFETMEKRLRVRFS